MGWFSKIEHATAAKLKEIFIDTKKLVEHSEHEIEVLEGKLIAERERVAKLSAKAHGQVIAARDKAIQELENLNRAVVEAEALAAHHAGRAPSAAQPFKVADKAEPKLEPEPAPAFNIPVPFIKTDIQN